mgnify:CR=1 FL=1
MAFISAILLIILFEVNVYAIRYRNRINTVYKDKSICFSCSRHNEKRVSGKMDLPLWQKMSAGI